METIPKEATLSGRYRYLTGKDVWRENLRLAVFASDKIRNTLGPKGAYKMISYNRGPEQVVKVTKDAITFLEDLTVQYPSAVVVAESAKLQREEIGDGAASLVVLISSLLKKADEMRSMGIHANSIVHGYQLATEKTLEIIEREAVISSCFDEAVLDIVDCGRKNLDKKLRCMIFTAFSVAMFDGTFEKDNVRFVKKVGGSLDESSLVNGIIIKKTKSHPNMPDGLQKLRIAIITQRVGINRLNIKMPKEGPMQIELKINDSLQLIKYKEAESKLNLETISKLVGLNINVLLCQQPIDDNLKDKLLLQGIFAIENIEKKDIEVLARATNTSPVGRISELTSEDVGFADKLFTDKIELESITTISGCKGATFLLRGSTQQAVDDLENLIKNSLKMLKVAHEDSRVLHGAGAIEVEIAKELKSFALELASREQLVVESFGDSLMEIPKCLAQNYGLDPNDILTELKKQHSSGNKCSGVSEHGCQNSICIEPIAVKRSIIKRANEIAALMLKIDMFIISKEIAKFHKK